MGKPDFHPKIPSCINKKSQSDKDWLFLMVPLLNDGQGR
ncbi:hypothetical protein D2M30_3691 [Bacillus amyloliquefaciens]|nr:hypothetical protein D2M30_3691 [Bacillus amyloliquefaciens]